MRKVLILLLLLSANSLCNAQIIDHTKIEYQIKKISKNKYTVSFIMTFSDDQRIISPFSEDSFWYKTSITYLDSSNITIIGPLTESPESKEEFDPISEENVRFNRKHVTFTQTIQIIGHNNFTVNGQIEYMIITDEYALPPAVVDFNLIYDERTGVISME